MRDTYRAIEYWKQAADPGAAPDDVEHRFERRRLHASVMLDGMLRIDGVIDPEGSSIFVTALRSITDSQQLDAEDTRTPAPRRADALTDICGFCLENADTPGHRCLPAAGFGGRVLGVAPG